VVNSARHTRKGTPIWVRVHRGEDGTTILVEDAGPGVPHDLREVIFEPFRHGGDGLGIGLSLVARFATLHGGWARVGDREGGGASFEVFLPDGSNVGEVVPDGVELAAS
jgi:signal transduction histidine kinase